MTLVATFPKLAHDWLVHELDPQLFRRAGVIASGSNAVTTGTVLGAVALGAAVSAAKSGGNTGDGTCVVDVTTPVLASAKSGVYKLRFTTLLNIRIEGPDGVVLGDNTIGGSTGNAATIAEHIKAAVTQGATPFAIGDGFDITVAVGTKKYVPLSLAALNGSQNAAAILINSVDATSGDVASAVLIGNAQIVANQLTWPDGATSDQKTAALAQLAALGIVSHQR